MMTTRSFSSSSSRVAALLVAGMASLSACDSKSSATPDALAPMPMPKPAADAARAAAAAAGDATFPLAEGERYYGGQLATNPLAWKTSDGTVVHLALVGTGAAAGAGGREEGVLRARYPGADGAVQTQNLETFSVDPGVEHWAKLEAVANGRVVFRFGQTDSGPLARNAVVLAWDADAHKVRTVKRWHGPAKDAEPAWLATGIYAPGAEAGTACSRVVARISACGKDPKFREALFRSVPAGERTAMEAHLDGHLVEWRKPAAVKSQCGRWASDEFVETTFAEPTRLARLAEDTKMTCEYFGREIDDEGGLPRSATSNK